VLSERYPSTRGFARLLGVLRLLIVFMVSGEFLTARLRGFLEVFRELNA
jgi:hypothetical protein